MASGHPGERLADCLRSMGFLHCKTEPDIWMRRVGDVYEYIATYVDDLEIASKDPKAIIDELLKHPPREPEYRKGRAHSEFVTNLNVDAEHLSESLRQTWRADSVLDSVPLDLVQDLLQSRYSQASWNLQR